MWPAINQLKTVHSHFKRFTMTKYFFTLLASFIGNSVFSQLYVGPANAVFINDAYFYVQKDISLQNNSNLYLRNESQLFQGTTNTSQNSGEGKLSVYQEGTVNEYQYNYWCSPIGNAGTLTGNENFGITLLNQPVSATLSSPIAVISNSYNGVANPLGIAQYWIFKYLTSNNYSQWIPVGAATTVAPGEGFTMKGTNGTDNTTVAGIANNPDGKHQRYDFRGKPNDGNISITVADNQYTLTGNPYPSAIDLSAFLTEETNCTGVAYFWEHDKTVNSHNIASYRGGYGIYSPVSRGGTGIYVPATYYSYDGAGNQTGVYSNPNNIFERYFSPIGQGFVIQGNAAGTTVTMKNKYRVYTKEGAAHFSQFERATHSQNEFLPAIPSVSGFDYTQVSQLAVPQIRFNILLNNQGIRQLALGFDAQSTDEIERAKDALLPPDNAPAESYFVIDNKKIAINITAFDVHKTFPIGFTNAEQANYKITVKEILNFNAVENVYLHDKITHTYYDIKNDFYDLTLPPGTNETQYEITFLSPTLGTHPFATDTVFIFQNNSTHSLVINNPSLVDIKNVCLFDVSGRKVIENEKMGSKTVYEISNENLSDGVYIVRLAFDNGQLLSKKIIVKK